MLSSELFLIEMYVGLVLYPLYHTKGTHKT